MGIFNDKALESLKDEMTILKSMVEQEGRRSVLITGNAARSIDNRKRIEVLERRVLRTAGMVTAMYLYLKTQRGFNRKRFLGILESVAQDPKVAKAKGKDERFD